VLKKSRYLFPEQLWNPLAVCAVPAFVFAEGKPVLSPAETSVYAIACADAEEPKNNCTFTRSLSELQTLTGFSDRHVVIDAVKGLMSKCFIRLTGEHKPGSKDAQTYELLNPRTAEGLGVEGSDSRNFLSLRSALYQAGLGYFNMPLDVVRGMSEKGSSELVLFFAIARCAGKIQDRDFEIKAAELRDLSGLDPKTFKKVVVRIDKQWVQIGFTTTDCRAVAVFLIDPASKKLLSAFEREQKDRDNEAIQKRVMPARMHSAQEILAWTMWALRNDNPKPASGAEFMFTCQLCRNKKSHKPKMTVNPFKGLYGVFHCYDCGYGGGLKKITGSQYGVWEAAKMLASIKSEQPALYAKATALLKGYGPSGYIGRGAAA
jgi:hypothetical protein